MKYAALLLLVFAACNSSKKSEEPPPTPVKMPTIKCQQAVTAAMKAKYFPDGKMTSGDDPIDAPDNGKITSCHYRSDKRLVAIDIRCGATYTDVGSYTSSVESQVNVKYERATDGRGGFALSKPGKSEFSFVPTKLPCQVDVEISADDPANVFDAKPLALAIADALGN